MADYSYAQPKPSKINSDHIRFDHFGPIDKPIIPLIITCKKLNLPVTELEILVNHDVFEIVSHYVDTSKFVGTKWDTVEFGVFKVTKAIRRENRTRYLPTRVKSIQFLKEIKSEVVSHETSERLIKEIDYILSRIDWPDE